MVKIQVNSQGKAYYTSAGKVLLAPEGGSSGKYSLLERISDDSNNEIGTVCGFFTDSNDVEYAVVCLDAQYRLSFGKWCDDNYSLITNMPVYNNLATANAWEAKETATENTQLILDYCTAKNYTSTACSHCRSKSFNIDGITYYGQLPNLIEVAYIIKHYSDIEIRDTSASSQSSLNFSSPRDIWASIQNYYNKVLVAYSDCTIIQQNKNYSNFVCPVLELPNA